MTTENLIMEIKKLKDENENLYSGNDIGTSRLFYRCFENAITYVTETKTWYIYKGRFWKKDDSNLTIMEFMKKFVLSYITYAESTGDEELEKFSKKLYNRSKRENILKDTCSIAPKSLSMFDSNPYLFNCKNGTFNLETRMLQPHSPKDFITKMADVTYNSNATCDRWLQFVSEIMNNDVDSERFLQKSFGYALSGEINLECFFIFYGNTTRNGKSTACETIANVLGDYATNAQAKTVAKNNRDGASATPDIARLKGARYVTMAEPEKALEIDVSLIKQLTGGDKYTGRFLNENPIEFVPEFKIFINTNHLPRVNDDTIFSSERIKILPFTRHFEPSEQDTTLKGKFKNEDMKSGILNWLINGYRMLKLEGLTIPTSVMEATKEYREESDTFGMFLEEITIEIKNNRLKTSVLYKAYKNWTTDNGYKALNVKNFINELRKKYDVKRNGTRGNEVIDIGLITDCPPVFLS